VLAGLLGADEVTKVAPAGVLIVEGSMLGVLVTMGTLGMAPVRVVLGVLVAPIPPVAPVELVEVPGLAVVLIPLPIVAELVEILAVVVVLGGAIELIGIFPKPVAVVGAVGIFPVEGALGVLEALDAAAALALASSILGSCPSSRKQV